MSKLRNIIKAVLLSYAQIFFTQNVWTGFALLLLTFIAPLQGLAGLAASVIAIAAGRLFHFNRHYLHTGLYTFNAVLTGIGASALYQPGIHFVLVLAFYAGLSLFLSVWAAKIFSSKGLPFLTIPFLICLWMMHLGHNAFGNIPAIYHPNALIPFWDKISVGFKNSLMELPIGGFLHLMLRSVAEIFFLHDDLAGFILLLIILFHSRIAFLLSVLGFAMGYAFYLYFSGDVKELATGFVSFNYMLTAIALGGFFIVPSAKSFLLSIFNMFFCALLIGALVPLFGALDAPIYSLPFVLVTITLLAVLKLSSGIKGLQPVLYQQFQPEANLYKNFFDKLRFSAQSLHHIYLPIMGEWNISQGIGGDITHKDEWKFAWDFDIRNTKGKTYDYPGVDLRDFLAWGLPVIAPASGYIAGVVNHVKDNEIGRIDTHNNWGNTVVIKIAEQVFVQLSHLKMHSILVKEGDYVYSGQQIATCGNSGRSPEPHLHLQVQATPKIGEKTLRYPIAYFLSGKKGDHFAFRSFDYPAENETVKNIVPEKQLQQAFAFEHNRQIRCFVRNRQSEKESTWKAGVDAYNKTYLYDEAYDTYVYFQNDGVVFYCYDFIGNKKSSLFIFYLTCQKILLGNYKRVQVQDWVMPQYIYPKALLWLHDFVAPFKQFLKAKYISFLSVTDKDMGLATYRYQSQIKQGSRTTHKAEILIVNGNITGITFTYHQKTTELICRNT